MTSVLFFTPEEEEVDGKEARETGVQGKQGEGEEKRERVIIYLLSGQLRLYTANTGSRPYITLIH